MDFSLFMSLIRSLFPRWDFFDRIAYDFRLQLRDSRGTWIESTEDSSLSWGNIFLNPTHLRILAENNVVEHFARDVQELSGESEKIVTLTSYRLLKDVVMERTKSFGLSGEPEFRVMAIGPNEELEIFHSGDVLGDS